MPTEKESRFILVPRGGLSKVMVRIFWLFFVSYSNTRVVTLLVVLLTRYTSPIVILPTPRFRQLGGVFLKS